MPVPSVAEYYHERTKYSPEGMGRTGRGLDFNKQPLPFKSFPHGTAYDLARFLPPGDELGSDTALAAWREALPPDERALCELAHLLYFTNGVTGVIPQPGQPFFMRAAPSAGGLYPTEIYLAVRQHPLLPDGLYNYQVRDHSLVQFWAGDAWPGLADATWGHPALEATNVALVLSGVFFRSAWRYEDRAYRRVLLDSGHVLGNLALYAPLVGRHALPIGGFSDARLNDLMFFDPADEGSLAIVALLPAGASDVGPTALASPRHASRDVPEGRRLEAMHVAGHMTASAFEAAETVGTGPEKYTFGSGETLESSPLRWGGGLGPTILARRSTRAYSGEPLTRDELARLLDFTYRPDISTEAGLERHPRFFAPELLETFIAVHRVTGLEPGCYHYAPAKRELRQTRFTSLRDEVQYLALGQELAGQAGAVVFHTADLPAAVARYGDRVYRYLHLDAGHLGQRLNVGAVKLGLGVSGIGGFFDDQVNDLLGIPAREAVLYLTTLGRPR